MINALLGAAAGAVMLFVVLCVLTSRRPRGMQAHWMPRLRRSNRYIFRYHDGAATRWGDPVQILTALHCDEEYQYRVHPKRVEAGDVAAVEVTLRAVRRAFGVEEWKETTQTGLTQAETLQLLQKFSGFMVYLKKKLGPLRLPRFSTDSTPDGSTGVTIPSSSDFWKTTTPAPLARQVSSATQ